MYKVVDTLNIPTLGKLEIVETYAYYDEPVLFSCKNAEGDLYLVVAADENDQYETWLYAQVSSDRLNLIQTDTIDLHDAFANTENGWILQVKFRYDKSLPESEFVQSDQVPDEMLPESGEYLNLQSEGLPIAFTITGKLTGAFLSSKIFEIETLEKTYTGKIADKAYDTVSTATLSRKYTAEIQEIIRGHETTDEIIKTEYQLLSLIENR